MLRNEFLARPFFVDTRGGREMAIKSRETGNLIGSDKVEGTAVYGADSEKIGTIEHVTDSTNLESVGSRHFLFFYAVLSRSALAFIWASAMITLSSTALLCSPR